MTPLAQAFCAEGLGLRTSPITSQTTAKTNRSKPMPIGPPTKMHSTKIGVTRTELFHHPGTVDSQP
ncbi:hypothetical protein GCM10010342_65510 [Streptomyces anulatus]|nr:hypothetical protein GCM10010342_65510 [Streptomyces anulatus]